MKSGLLLFLTLALFAQTQTSHRSLCLELVKDLQKSITDSTSTPVEEQILVFTGTSELVDYMQDITGNEKASGRDFQWDSIRVNLQELSLSLDPVNENNFRNSQFRRQLKLAVDYRYNDRLYTWQGSITDRVSKNELGKILNEWFPVPISGNYRRGQPASLSIIITSVGVLSLAAVLFFIRS